MPCSSLKLQKADALCGAQAAAAVGPSEQQCSTLAPSIKPGTTAPLSCVSFPPAEGRAHCWGSRPLPPPRVSSLRFLPEKPPHSGPEDSQSASPHPGSREAGHGQRQRSSDLGVPECKDPAWTPQPWTQQGRWSWRPAGDPGRARFKPLPWVLPAHTHPHPQATPVRVKDAPHPDASLAGCAWVLPPLQMLGRPCAGTRGRGWRGRAVRSEGISG